MLQKVENYRHALDQLEKTIISYSFIYSVLQVQKSRQTVLQRFGGFYLELLAGLEPATC